MEPERSVPLAARILVRLAAWLAPAHQRARWLDGRRASLRSCWAFLLDRPEFSLTPRAEILQYAMGSFRDAWDFRKAAQEPSWVAFVHSPAFPLVATTCLVLVVGLLAGGFRALRSFLPGATYPGQERLITLWQDFGALGRRIGIPAATLREWDSKSTLMSGFAAYYQRRVPLSRSVMETREVREARVTADLFLVLNVKPLVGRSFQPLDAYAGSAKTLLSYQLWRDVFDGDPGIVGRTVTLDGQAATVLGVMPRGFWFPNQLVQIWTLFPLYPDTPPHVPYLLTTIGRLKPDVSPLAARAELRRLGAGVHVNWNGSMVEVSSLEEGPIGSLQIFCWALPLGMFIGVLAARLVIGRNPWRYWLYFTAKAGVAFVALTLIWIELTGPRTIAITGWADPGSAWLSLWWFLTASILVVWWAIRDQRRRCPVCCRRLTLPVTIGTYSSPMLEPVQTELFCERGHGILYVPGGLSTDRPEWRPLDSSWEQLFH